MSEATTAEEPSIPHYLHLGSNGKTEEGCDLLERSLNDEKRREIHLVAAKTLGTLRHETSITKKDIKDSFDTEHSTLILGKRLGQGGFSSVFELRDDPSIVCKFLSDDTLMDEKRLPGAAADIVREAHFLSTLHHENIIALQGIGSLDDMAKYFLLLQRIETPLSKKMDEWGLATAENEELYERLEYAMAVVRALNYLHHENIVYRDLKIDNLGLDASNKVFLYDFGIAKILKGPDDNGKYKLTGKTGSWVYMAPEVAKGFKYNLKVDVYSFGIVLWELCSGEYAFADVIQSGRRLNKEARPSLMRYWPKPLEDLMKDCWNWNPNQRPTFDEVEERLEAVMKELNPRHNRKGFFW